MIFFHRMQVVPDRQALHMRGGSLGPAFGTVLIEPNWVILKDIHELCQKLPEGKNIQRRTPAFKIVKRKGIKRLRINAMKQTSRSQNSSLSDTPLIIFCWSELKMMGRSETSTVGHQKSKSWMVVNIQVAENIS